jgi:hypothetical protein
MNNAVAQLAINRLTIVPFTVHPVLQNANTAPLAQFRFGRFLSLICVIVTYNTTAHHASLFSLPYLAPNKKPRITVQSGVKQLQLALIFATLALAPLFAQSPSPGNAPVPPRKPKPVRIAPQPAPNVRLPAIKQSTRSTPNVVAYSVALNRYQHARHTRFWWRNHFTTIVLVAGGYYYWDAGYWFPAWGYDRSYEAYDYDGPIFTYGNLLPDQVIVNVQRALQDRGYYGGGISGALSPATRRAISAFQADEGLEVNGVVDGATVYALGLI